MRRIWPIVAVGFLGSVQVGCEYLSRFTWRDQASPPWHHPGDAQAVSDRDGLAHGLPAGLKMDTVLGVRGDGAMITVESRLLELGARAGKDGKLYDGGGREVYFYQRTLSPGNSPADDAALLSSQETELEGLRRQYTVIELSGRLGLP
jgi:hypothetical protein